MRLRFSSLSISSILKGFSPEFAGLILVAQPVVQTVVSPFAGRLSDMIEPRIVASIGMTLTAAGLFAFVFLSAATPLWSIVAVLLVLGLGYALFSSPNTNAIMSSVERRHYGVASSMVATMRAIGQLASIAIVMMIFSIVIGRVEVTPDVYPQFLASVQIAFLVLGVLNVFGIFASYARGKIRKPEMDPADLRTKSEKGLILFPAHQDLLKVFAGHFHVRYVHHRCYGDFCLPIKPEGFKSPWHLIG